MKARHLIEKLKRLDPESEVVIQDHDHSEDEMNGPVTDVIQSESPILIAEMGGPVITLS